MHKAAILENNSTFQKFGEYYDVIYADKDYEKDVNLVVGVIEEFAEKKCGRVLELGCGTGCQSILLAQRGYRVVGIDRSPVMLAAAKRKAAGVKPSRLEFRLMDVRAMTFREQFDACVSMFGCISYLTALQDLRETLLGVRRSLLANGIFVFDYWNERAVLAQKPAFRRRNIPLRDGGALVRVAIPSVDWSAKICAVSYQVSLLQGERVKESFEEVHRFRFFDPQLIAEELEAAGFEVLGVRTPEGAKNSLDESWFLFAIARRKAM